MLEQITDNFEADCAAIILDYYNQSIFLTGKAGTGKSTFIQRAIAFSKTCCVIGAPTGIAALNIGGRTLNSIFHLPPYFLLPEDPAISKIRWKEEDELIMVEADLIVVDEISMVGAATLDCIDVLARRICKSDKPFGGKRMLFVGDPFQLPPIIKGEDRDRLLSKYKSEYFFDSKAFRKLNPICVELLTTYRQTDRIFLDILNNIREGVNVAKSIHTLNECCCHGGSHEISELPNAITLTFTNKAATEKNTNELNKIASPEFCFTAEVKGEFNRQDIIAEERLQLKVGARVMMIHNDQDHQYVNGTLGFITEITLEIIKIKTDDGNVLDVERVTWKNVKPVKEFIDGKWHVEYEEVGSFTQYPVKFAWAITVHKSQGLTFDNVYLLNRGSAFASAQVYVALSRCRSLDGLGLYRPIKVEEVMVDARITKFYKQVQDTSRRDDLIGEWLEYAEEEAAKVNDDKN